MVSFAAAIAELGVDVVTFNFLYMEQRRRLPDRPAVLESCCQAVIEQVKHSVPSAARGLFAGGKSMGGRIATQVAAAHQELDLSGLVLLGYPLHPPGRPEQRRDAHLPLVRRPMLFIQGSRDGFGTPKELMAALAPVDGATLRVIEGGDHSFKLGGKDPIKQGEVHAGAQRTIVDWIQSVLSKTSPSGEKP